MYDSHYLINMVQMNKYFKQSVCIRKTKKLIDKLTESRYILKTSQFTYKYLIKKFQCLMF